MLPCSVHPSKGLGTAPWESRFCMGTDIVLHTGTAQNTILADYDLKQKGEYLLPASRIR